MDTAEVVVELQEITDNQQLFVPLNFTARADALDTLHYIREMLIHNIWSGDISDLLDQISALEKQLKALNTRLFDHARTVFIHGRLPARKLRRLLDKLTSYVAYENGHVHVDYENADIYVDGMLFSGPVPKLIEPIDPEMVHYEPSPVSVILDLIDHVPLSPSDGLVDLGSGLGLVVILVRLLADVHVTGIEVNPVYHAHAEQRINALGLSGINLILGDAREVNLDRGTVFFLFTPFTGTILATVLERIRGVAQLHPVTVCSFGPVTPEIARQTWLNRINAGGDHPFKLAIFRS